MGRFATRRRPFTRSVLHLRSKSAVAIIAAVTLPLPLSAFAAERQTADGSQPAGTSVQPSAPPNASNLPPDPFAVAAPSAAPPAPAAHRRSKRRRHHRRHHARRHKSATKPNPNQALALSVSHGGRRVLAHAANDPSDTIANYKFTPGTLTIHVGDTVTWTNEDSVQHSATASNGSFNTGLLSKGASASHTFTQAGTFPYVCEIHPFMHGTIVVEASTASATPGTTTPSSTTPTTSTPSASSTSPSSSSTGSSNDSSSGQSDQNGTQTLPFTGFDALGAWLAGVALFGAGLLIRRKTRSDA